MPRKVVHEVPAPLITAEQTTQSMAPPIAPPVNPMPMPPPPAQVVPPKPPVPIPVVTDQDMGQALDTMAASMPPAAPVPPVVTTIPTANVPSLDEAKQNLIRKVNG